MNIHQREVHRDYVDGCYMCKIGTVTCDSSTRPTANVSQQALTINAREARWNKDLPAYKRMRDAGLQPKSTEGAARIEREATSRFEVESGQIIPHAEKKIAQAIDMITDVTGSSPLDAVTTPVSEVA